LTDDDRPSPRKVAIAAILKARDAREGPAITDDAWERVINEAWDDRSLSGDRRELRKSIDAVLRTVKRADS
jgi:hypothetical protein